MKRLYYLTDSVTRAECVSDDIHKLGVSDWNFHVMSRDKDGLTKHHLHSTNPLIHERDMICIGERGALIGTFAGIFATFSFFFVMPDIPVRLVSQTLILFICLAFGMGGAFLGATIGLARENAKITRFHDFLEAGNYLLMIDMHKNDAPRIEKMMTLQQGVQAAGEGNSIVNPFQPALNN